MQKVTVIIGEPCTGKSLLMKELMKLDEWDYHSATRYIPKHWNTERQAYILGRYDDTSHKYPGTDRMSMACQPRVIEYIAKHRDLNFILEGDRLGNASFLSAIRDMEGVDLEVIHLWLRPEWLAKRRAEQRPDQNEKFWRSRKTKIHNMTDNTGCVIRRKRIEYKAYEHVTLADTHNIIAHIRKERIPVRNQGESK